MLGYERALVRGRNLNWYFQTDFTRKRGETLFGTNRISQDDLAVLGMMLRYDRIIASSNVIESGFLRVDHGFDDQFGVPSDEEIAAPTFLPRPSRAGSVPSFDKLTFGYSRLKAVTARNTLLLRFSAQWTDDELAPMEQFSIGGANQVRALPVSWVLGDKGAFASAEWTVRMGQNWTGSAFYDHSIAWTNNAIVAATEQFDMGGYGVTLGYSRPGSWSWKYTWAKVVGGKDLVPTTGDPNRITDATQIWIDVNYRF